MPISQQELHRLFLLPCRNVYFSWNMIVLCIFGEAKDLGRKSHLRRVWNLPINSFCGCGYSSNEKTCILKKILHHGKYFYGSLLATLNWPNWLKYKKKYIYCSTKDNNEPFSNQTKNSWCLSEVEWIWLKASLAKSCLTNLRRTHLWKCLATQTPWREVQTMLLETRYKERSDFFLCTRTIFIFANKKTRKAKVGWFS